MLLPSNQAICPKPETAQAWCSFAVALASHDYPMLDSAAGRPQGGLRTTGLFLGRPAPISLSNTSSSRPVGHAEGP
jgi:hypothetical protein